MSFLNDPSYLIYQMRLALINNDQTAKKIVTLPIYSEDDYLVYSNSPEDNTYSSSPNITMMGSDLYQSKKGKPPFSPFLGTPSARNQHQLPSQQSSKMLKSSTKSSQVSSNNLQLPQKNESGKNFSQNDSKIKVDAEQDRSNANNNNNNNLNNASTLINKNLNSNTNTNTSYIPSTNKPNELINDVEPINENDNENNNINETTDSNSCRSTNSLQLEDEDDAEYNDSLSSSNDSKDKGPMEAPVITENLFVKQKNLLTLDGGRSVPKNKPLVSNLSQLLKQNNSSSNPFADYRFFVIFFFLIILYIIYIIIIYIYYIIIYTIDIFNNFLYL